MPHALELGKWSQGLVQKQSVSHCLSIVRVVSYSTSASAPAWGESDVISKPDQPQHSQQNQHPDRFNGKFNTGELTIHEMGKMKLLL